MKFLWLLLLLLSGVQFVFPTRIDGIVRYGGDGGKVIFLTKFGVERGGEVVAFGTAKWTIDLVSFGSRMTLAFVPQDVWDSFYHESTKRETNCELLMNSTALVHSRTPGDSCPFESGEQDYLRQVPCSAANFIKPCTYQSSPLVNGSQFTYHINSSQATEYYYLTFIACTKDGRNASSEPCEWEKSLKVNFTYDMQIVNSDISLSRRNPFTYQFPYDFQGVLIAFIVSTMCYIVLVVFHFVIHAKPCTNKRHNMHRLTKIFTVSLVLETFYVFFQLIHYAVYAHDGMGVIALRYIGEVCNKFADWLLILVLILIGKGWQVTMCTIRWKRLTFAVWAGYIVSSAVYFAWLVVQDQVYPLSTETINGFQTWGGGIYLAYRLLLLLYILYEVRQVYLIENHPTKLHLYVGLVVVYVVWFCYLPLVVVIVCFINPVERGRVVSASILTFDLLINGVMVILFCPWCSNHYFQFDSYLNELRTLKLTLKAYGVSNSEARPI